MNCLIYYLDLISAIITGPTVNKAKLKESTYLLGNLDDDICAMKSNDDDPSLKRKGDYEFLDEQDGKKSM